MRVISAIHKVILSIKHHVPKASDIQQHTTVISQQQEELGSVHRTVVAGVVN